MILSGQISRNTRNQTQDRLNCKEKRRTEIERCPEIERRTEIEERRTKIALEAAKGTEIALETAKGGRVELTPYRSFLSSFRRLVAASHYT